MRGALIEMESIAWPWAPNQAPNRMSLNESQGCAPRIESDLTSVEIRESN